MNEDPAKIEEMRPLIYQHVVWLTASGHSPAHALAIAVETAVMMRDDRLVAEAIELAERAKQLAPSTTGRSEDGGALLAKTIRRPD